jgi:hypothetical protein
VFEFARMILEIHPKTMMFENVPGIIDMVTPDGVPVLDAFGRILEDGSFMTIDALKRTVEAQTGAVGILMLPKLLRRSYRLSHHGTTAWRHAAIGAHR